MIVIDAFYTPIYIGSCPNTFRLNISPTPYWTVEKILN